MADNNINISGTISQKLYDLHIKKYQLAEKLGVCAPTLANMLSRNACSAGRLIQISRLLNYNFFQHIANQLNIPDPPQQTGDSNNPQASDLQTEVNRLKEENAYLKKIIDTFSTITQKPGK